MATDTGIDYGALAAQAEAGTPAPNPVNPLVPIGIGVGGLGIAGAAATQVPRVMRAGGRAQRAIGRLIARRIPGVGEAMDIADAVKEIRGQGAPAEATARPPVGTPQARTALPPTVKLTKADLKHPEFSRFKVGYEMDRKLYEKTLMKPAKGAPPPTRKINVKGKPRARAPEPTKEPPYSGGRGASGPELERRAAQLKGEPIPGTVAARAKAASAPRMVGNVIEGPGAGTPAEAAAAREEALAGMRAARLGRLGAIAGSPELELLMLLSGAGNVPEQMDLAREQMIRGAYGNQSPALLRALLDQGGSQGF